MEIRLATQADMGSFFNYLDQHLAENGDGNTSVFQPMSRAESRLNEGMKSRFNEGIKTVLGEPGWRRLWLAFDGSGQVVGHIDVRSHPEQHTGHRALLGMGVDSSARKQGLGKRLMEAMTAWVKQESSIEYVDLWVLSSNTAALALYHRCGFNKQGEIADMFRIDGQSLSYTMMTSTV